MQREHTEDDLWCSVMPCANDRRMVLILERGTPEIDKADIGRVENPLRLGLISSSARYGYHSEVITDKEDVFRFEVGVDEVEVMEN